MPRCSKNTKADALSRQTEIFDQNKAEEHIIPEALLLAPVQWDIMTELTQANEQTAPPATCPVNSTYIPAQIREKVLHHVHDSLSSGHPGITAALSLLRNRFWWETMPQDVTQFIHHCTACQTSKQSHQLIADLLQPLPIPQRP